jgi:hypothetical protein
MVPKKSYPITWEKLIFEAGKKVFITEPIAPICEFSKSGQTPNSINNALKVTTSVV